MDNIQDYEYGNENESTVSSPQRVLELSMSMPNFPLEDTPLLQDAAAVSPSYRSLQPSKSFITTQGSHPYTQENKPKRRPFHLTPARRISSEQESHLYARFRYYSRLRAPAPSDDLALSAKNTYEDEE